MILPFKERFVQSILTGTKIHTIREDKKKRWSVGRKIHFSSKVRTPDQYCFLEMKCKGLQKFSIYWRGNKDYPVGVFVGGRELNLDEQEILALNDGFDNVDDFYKWFNNDFIGIIIHWTDMLY